MILSNVYATFLLVIAQITARGNAQLGVADWMWKFGSGETGEAGFDECQRVPLLIIPGKISPSGVPPYYLLAFEVGGTPTTQMIGSSSAELLWTVDHKQGTQLLITVMDSTRTIGGIPPTPYNIHAGHDTSCFPPLPQNPPIIHPNVTGTLRNCEPWGLSVTGGKKPYTIVFAAANNPVLENGTMGVNDDVYTYINRSKPDRQLMASVADADGQWGQSTQLIETLGDTDFDCGSQVSSSGTSAQTTQQDKKDVKLIAGLSAGLGIAAVLAIAALFRVVRRRTQKRNKLRIRSNSDTSVSLLEESAADMTQVYPEGTTGPQPKAGVRISCATTPLYPSHELMQASSSSSDSTYTQSKTYGAGSPLSPTYPRSPTTLSPTFVGTTTHTPDSQPLVSTTGRGDNGIEELPPPYMERSAHSARSSQPSFAPLSTTAGVPGVSAGSNVAGTPGEVSPSLEGVGTSGLGPRI